MSLRGRCRRDGGTCRARARTLRAASYTPKSEVIMDEPALNFDAPLMNISVSLQRSSDCVGHALRALEEYRPTRDHTLNAEIVAALGVSTESHVPGAPIALQFGPSIPMNLRRQVAAMWVLQKGF